MASPKRLPSRPDLAERLSELLPEIGEVPPLERGPLDDLVRVARALATGSQGRGLGPDVCSRLYAELRDVVGELSATGGSAPAGEPMPSPAPSSDRLWPRRNVSRNGLAS